jgi:DNA-binding transcriptional LysR family regulator
VRSAESQLPTARIVQEGSNEATILSLVSSGLGVGWVLGTARWRCPETVVVLPVVDLNMPLTLALASRRDRIHSAGLPEPVSSSTKRSLDSTISRECPMMPHVMMKLHTGKSE